MIWALRERGFGELTCFNGTRLKHLERELVWQCRRSGWSWNPVLSVNMPRCGDGARERDTREEKSGSKEKGVRLLSENSLVVVPYMRTVTIATLKPV